ncbi:MAG: hypothetical protein A3D67_02610 [Candidatus Lloydbacteria bacterium RIFCSPHIGHO2_02_FULL_51_22]|uniref:Uncharacterized protein n=2 Tax=Candidatus Lloydiibacteriota TaxID=1817910 RepID=A0A1G2DCZ5_9BACT|nr:MAG: hypothetical protein A3D67_02610 [Candidatus Lloydbacteria bacterium RIFCSPHIGHO2_02_FULL_51_22]OGZ15306.1 MAG: hypothetical protein A3J08_00820 [Candidatus Lloydbacteria bacterium RIFCSPLOWO2_02_FULL_51_11]
MVRRLLIVFFTAFLLNFLWENIHAVLYVQYQGGEITRLILFRAALFDAAVITLFAALLLVLPWPRARPWVMLALGVVFAVGLEWFALATGRWEYNTLMPLIPFLNVGLSPAIQLGVTGWGALVFALIRTKSGASSRSL